MPTDSKPPRIDIISDIHLTHLQDFGKEFVHTWMPDGDILILAGDVGEFHWWRDKLPLIEALCEKYSHVLYVAGNHDYYGTSLKKGDDRFHEIDDQISNFHFLEKEIFEIAGVKFAGCTLWFKEDPGGWIYERWMNDFSQIKHFKPAVYGRNLDSQEFLRSLQDVDVIITHHLPTYLSVNERYTNDVCNRFFLCEMDDVILGLQPKIWYHGHTHISCDYKLGATRIICNPMGYPRENDFGKKGYRPVTVEL